MYVREPFTAEGNWDQFENYCMLNGISMDHEDDWMSWWECWNAALDSADSAQLEDMDEDSIDIEWDDDDIPF